MATRKAFQKIGQSDPKCLHQFTMPKYYQRILKIVIFFHTTTFQNKALYAEWSERVLPRVKTPVPVYKFSSKISIYKLIQNYLNRH